MLTRLSCPKISPPPDYHLLLQNDFHLFLHRAFCELNSRTAFLDNWHIAVLAAKLEGARRGVTKRLIINLPPRHLKSHAASIAWMLGHDPSAQLLCVSYGQELSDGTPWLELSGRDDDIPQEPA
jgi:hypothetical protein